MAVIAAYVIRFITVGNVWLDPSIFMMAILRIRNRRGLIVIVLHDFMG